MFPPAASQEGVERWAQDVATVTFTGTISSLQSAFPHNFLAPLLPSYKTQGKPLNHFVPQFLPLQNESTYNKQFLTP